MKIATTVSTTTANVATRAVGLVTPANAAADQGTSADSLTLGGRATLTDGEVKQGWTVSKLKPDTETTATSRTAGSGRPPSPIMLSTVR